MGILTRTTTDDRYDHFTRETTSTRPRGYPQLSSYIATDIDGRLYRRYAYLRNRLLLHKQDQLAELEEQLDKLDATHAADDEDFYRLCSRRFDDEDKESKRRKLIKQIDDVLKEYDDLLLREHHILSIHTPSRKAHRGYFDYIWNEKPVVKEEYQFIYREDDFVMLGDQHDRWLGYTEFLVSVLPRVVLKYLLTRKEDRKAVGQGKDGTRFYSNERTTRMVKMLVVTATSLMLVVPIVVLYVLTVRDASGGVRVAVTSIFTVVFALTLAIMTHASRHETFAAVAAYSAVLVVFLGNVPGNGKGSGN